VRWDIPASVVDLRNKEKGVRNPVSPLGPVFHDLFSFCVQVSLHERFWEEIRGDRNGRAPGTGRNMKDIYRPRRRGTIKWARLRFSHVIQV